MTMEKQNTHYINGTWFLGEGQAMDSTNPANGELVWRGRSATQEQVNAAVDAAKKAQEMWYSIGVEARIQFIETFTQLLSKRVDAWTYAIAEETGKTLWETETEVKAMLSKMDLSIQAYYERTGEYAESLSVGDVVIRHKPHGVMAVYGPFNFPGHLPNGHIIPALIAGNTIVLKPSELTPRVGQMMAELWNEAALPAGVLNLVQGEKETGQYLAQNPNVNGVLFTGSSKVGHQLHANFAGQPDKMLALEMGGNNPLIVSRVKNTQAAVHDIIQSAFLTAGQRCTCARRLFLPNGQAGDVILAALKAAVCKIQVQPFNAPEQPFIGSLISEQAALDILTAQNKLLAAGGQIIVPVVHLKKGTGLTQPGLIDMSQSSYSEDKEYFGPLLQVYRYETFEEAIVMANQTKYGLSAGLLSDSRDDYEQFVAQIRAGIVNWNKQMTGALGQAPFGGVGASGNHRASAYYAADYCAYPVASIEQNEVSLPKQLAYGLSL
jgi:succinylglutamic semialdehyde dehydrogenase